jgi:hypothetical protein
MSDQVYAFTPVIPAGTAIATPYTQQLVMPACVVVSIGVLVPPGPRGTMGFALGAAGVPIIPAAPGTWFVVDDFADDWPIENQISSGAWEFFGYNLGNFPHTVYLRFAVNFPNLVGATAPQALDATAISNEPSQPSPTGT